MPILVFAVPDFEVLQGSRTAKWKKLKIEDLNEVRFYKDLFDQNFTSLPSDGLRIPEVIHFIWLGPRPFPQESIKNIASWKAQHPKWTFKFWTDDPKRPCPFSYMEKHLISELELPHIGMLLERSQNWGEKSDMLRYEILFKEGGIYVDHDVICYRSFSALNGVYDFYACLETPHLTEGQETQIFACNCVIGAIAKHPIFESMMHKIAMRWDDIEMMYPTNISRVMHRTFLAFTESVREHAYDKTHANIIFPASYFFPDQVYPKKTQKKLRIKPYASHSFAGLWTEGPPNEIKELQHKHHLQLKKIHRRINRLYYLIAASFLLAIAFCTLQLRKHKKT